MAATCAQLWPGLSHPRCDGGVITLALIANGSIAKDASVPTWVIIAAATSWARRRQARGGGELGRRRPDGDRLAADPPRRRPGRRCAVFVTDEIGMTIVGPLVVSVLAALAAEDLFLHTHRTSPVSSRDV